jgi:hypothetical protein
MVVPARYEEPLFFSDGLALVRHSRNDCRFHEYVDQSGRTAIPERPGWGEDRFSGGYAHVFSSKKAGYIDKKGNLAISARPEWQGWGPFSDNLAPVMIDGQWDFINAHGRLVVPARFQPPIKYVFTYGCFADTEVHDPLAFSEKLAPVGFGGKAGYIDWSGKFVIPPRFDAALPFSDGMARVQSQGKWGYVDRGGKVVILPRFEEAGGFSEGLAPVKADGRWGFIDKKGAFAIPARFELATEFQSGLAEAKSSSKTWIYIDKTGGKVWDSPSRF